MGIDYNSIIFYGIIDEEEYEKLPTKLREALENDSEVYGIEEKEGKAGLAFKGFQKFDQDGDFAGFGWPISRTDFTPEVIGLMPTFNYTEKVQNVFYEYKISKDKIHLFHFVHQW